MKKMIAAVLAFICSGVLLVADIVNGAVPETIPIGTDAVKAYQYSTINQYGVDLYCSTNVSNPNDRSSFVIMAYTPRFDYTVTNGEIDESLLRKQIEKVSQVALTKGNPGMLFVSHLLIDTTNNQAYARIESPPFRLVLGLDGRYTLPSEATNAPMVEYANVGIYVKGITRARVEITDWTGSYDVLDTATPADARCINGSNFLCPRWLLTTPGYEGTIYLYTRDSNAHTVVTRYSLTTGKKIPPLTLSAPRQNGLGNAEITITGPPGAVVKIQCSSDFLHWVDKGTATLSADGTFVFKDEKESHTCFYRVVQNQ